MRVRTKHVRVWTVSAVVIAFLLWLINGPTFLRLTMHGAPASATAAEILPRTHATVRYTFLVADRRYEGRAQLWRPNPEINNVKVGDHLVAFYDPQNPEVSVLGYPKAMLENELGTIALAATIFPTFILFALRRHRSRRELCVA